MMASTGRRAELTQISQQLHVQLAALKRLNTAHRDADIQWATLFVEDAIDRVDLAATAAFDVRVAA